MQAFDLLRPKTLKDALLAVRGENPPAVKAGGIDLLDRMKEGIDRPARILDILPLAEMRGIDIADKDLWIGALTTLAEIAASDLVRKHAPALAQAAGEAATPQIRSVATLGGNLFQRNRCWYYRNAEYEPCFQRGGKECFAKTGRNKIHAIFGTDAECVAVNASNLGPALIALDAKLEIGTETVACSPIDVPRENGRIEAFDALLAGKGLLRGVQVPLPGIGVSAYAEIGERESFDWALASCAVSFGWKGGIVNGPVRIVLGAVAWTPLLREEASKHLEGKKLTPDLAREAAAKAVEGAKPLSENAYKVQLAKVAVARAILAAAGMEEKR
jgi:xanthine dehydrogenase YagS FAD-binding subunit